MVMFQLHQHNINRSYSRLVFDGGKADEMKTKKKEKTIYRTATELRLMDSMRHSCCVAWITAVNGINITATDTYNPQNKTMAQTLEQLLRYQFGNYCPTCGTKLC